MEDKGKAKRKYTRKPKVEPLAVYSVMVKVTRGRKAETIYAESTRVENGCLVIVSMDGPQPLVERTRYIPFGSAEIEVCNRPQQRERVPQYIEALTRVATPVPYGSLTDARGWPQTFEDPNVPRGPRIEAGPLEVARRMAQTAPVAPVAAPRPTAMVERNAEGLPVVMGGFTDSGGTF